MSFAVDFFIVSPFIVVESTGVHFKAVRGIALVYTHTWGQDTDDGQQLTLD